MADDKGIAVDFDVSGLPQPAEIVAACETEDEIGCVLRMHFHVEKLLDFYCANSVTSEAKAFIKPVWEFRHKLERAVILGLPTPFAHAAKILAKIRNDAAHGGAPINRGHLDNLISRVDGLSAVRKDYTPLSKRWLQLPVSMPGETITLKSHSDRFDFVLAATALHTELYRWVVHQVMSRAAIAQQLARLTTSSSVPD